MKKSVVSGATGFSGNSLSPMSTSKHLVRFKERKDLEKYYYEMNGR